MSRPAPLWLIFVVQGTSVAGDTLGQRAARLHFKGSSRRMLIALTIVSAAQVVLILGLLQAFLPASVSGAIYDSSGEQLPCYREVDFDGRLPDFCSGGTHNCTVVPCPSQGPASVPRSIGLHPLLLLNGLQSIVYYVGEVLLYQQPMGLVLIVMASLVSSFVIAPFEAVFGIHEAQVPPLVILLGIVGAIACVLEVPLSPEQRRLPLAKLYGAAWRALRRGDWRAVCGRSSRSSRSSSVSGGGADIAPYTPLDAVVADGDGGRGASPTATADDPLVPGEATRESVVGHVLRIAVPFTMLALIYSAWFVTQRVFNAEYRTNMYGYTSLDQGMGPFYLLPALFLVDRVRPLRRTLVPREDRVGAAQRSAAPWPWGPDSLNFSLPHSSGRTARSRTTCERRCEWPWCVHRMRHCAPWPRNKSIHPGRPRRLHVAGVHVPTADQRARDGLLLPVHRLRPGCGVF